MEPYNTLPNNSPKYNKLLILSIIILLLIVGIFVYFFIFKKSPKDVPPVIHIVSTKIDSVKNISILPRDIVQEQNPIVTDSYEAKTDMGIIQNTYVYKSLFNVKKNTDLYKDYLTKNGWKPITVNVQNGITSIYTAKSNQSLSVMITAISTTTESTVDISLVTSPAK